MARLFVAIAVVLVATVGHADTTRELHLAARSGDLAEVKRMIASGVAVDAGDRWGTTALQLAAKNGHEEVARFLIEKGADPSSRETFFGMSALEAALWKGAPDYVLARILLAAGARDRAAALDLALEKTDLALARAAAKSGPVTESEARDLRARFSSLEGELQQVLAEVKTVADPPPPVYTVAQLQGFVGDFEGADDTRARVHLIEERLVLERGESRLTLAPTGDRVFGNAKEGVTVRYFGRAGTVEGIGVERAGEEPIRLRIGDGERPSGEPSQLAELAIEPAGEPTVHWPGFRGANRSGIGDGSEPPVDFDLASGAGVAWRVGIPGLGNSSPVVWGDRVYVTTAVADGGSVPLKVGMSGDGDEVEEKKEHRWLVLAHDKRSGKEIWRREVGRGVPLTKRHFKATQANSTPVTDGEHIVVVFPTAGLACLGKDGKIHWKHELGGLNAGGFNDPGIQWGFAASPILHHGKVILQVDIHDGPYIAAWDLETGKKLWQTARPDVAPSWATPAIWPTPTGEQVVANASIIRGYAPDSGREIWSLSPTSIQVVASPVVGSEHLYVSSGYPPARPIYAVKPGIKGAHTIDTPADASVLAWHEKRGGAYMPTPLLYRGLLYIVQHNCVVAAHDARDGRRVFRDQLSARGTCTSSPVAANGKIYQGTEEGTLYVLEAGSELRELGVHELGAALMATPAITEGMLILRTPGELIALAGGAVKTPS